MLPAELSGKYELRGTLGAGAMGIVLDAFDRLIERRVAIKLVKLPSGGDAEAMEEALEAHARFRREAQASGQLGHPNIVSVYDYGENANTAWIVMELVEGGTLKSLMDRGERFPVAEIVRVMDQVLAALAYSHGKGVVHRDIKPANIMLTADRTIKIADYGIARIESSTMTQVGTVMGTPSYMAPEQLRGETVDARADIWAAGVVLYQLLTGEKPFDGGYSALMHRVMTTEPAPPSQLAVSAPRAFDAVVARALAKRPDERFASAMDFAAAIRAAAGEKEGFGGFAGAGKLPGLDDGTMIGAAPPSARRSQPGPSAAPPAPPASGGSKMPLVLGGVGALVAAGVAAFFLMPGQPSPPPAAPGSVQTALAPPPATPTPAPIQAVPAAPVPQSAPASSVPSPAPPAAPVLAAPPPPAVATPAPPGPASSPPERPPAQDLMASGPSMPTPPQAPLAAAPPAAAPGAPLGAPLVTVRPSPPVPPPQIAPAPPAMAPTAPAISANPSLPISPPAPPPPPVQAPPATAPAAVQPSPPASSAARPSPPSTQAPPAPAATSPSAGPVIAALPTPAPASPAPPAQPASMPAPRVNFLAAAHAAAGAAPCSLLEAGATQTSLTVAGVLRRGGEAQVQRALNEAGVPASAATLRLSPFDGPYCGALDIVRQVAADAGMPPQVQILGTLPLQRNDLLRLDVTMPPSAGYLYVSYLMKSNEIVHLVPSQPQPGGVRVRLGEPAPNFPGWEVDEPYGTDLVLVFASERPLFPRPRPLLEPLNDFMPALTEALRNARAQGARVAARAIVVETVERR